VTQNAGMQEKYIRFVSEDLGRQRCCRNAVKFICHLPLVK
jgi:hypothetical protein